AQLLRDASDRCLGADRDQLDTRHLGKVLEVFATERRAQTGVMRTAGQEPGASGDLQVGSGLPEGAGQREARQVGWRIHHVDLVEDQAEPFAQVEKTYRNCRPWGGGEDETKRVRAPADRQRMDLAR